MKKILSLIAIIGMLASPVFAEVTLSTQNIDISTEMLKSNFDAYSVNFKNVGKNPVKVSNIDVKYMISNANQVLVSDALNGMRKNNKYLYLSFITFGVSGIVGNAKSNKILTAQKAALAEAATYTTDFNSIKSEVIMPNSTKTYKILVQKNQAPKVEAVFQDTKTNQYISVSGN